MSLLSQDVLVNFPWILLMPDCQSNSGVAGDTQEPGLTEWTGAHRTHYRPGLHVCPAPFRLVIKRSCSVFGHIVFSHIESHLFLMLFHREPVSVSKSDIKGK